MKGKRRLPSKIRLLVQVLFTALSNGYVKGLYEGRVFTGTSKYICVPGLNCYSCPGALFSCPIGALQQTLSGRGFKFSLYVAGFLVLFGTFLGRFTCGFLCPFGLLQDLLYKIPFLRRLAVRRTSKVSSRRSSESSENPSARSSVQSKAHFVRILSFLRYFILVVFVILLPLFFVDITGLGKPWFCKYICPAGTLEGGVPLVLFNTAMQSAAGFLFKWKLCILAAVLILSMIVYRPFCRFICPLGAIYGLFNKISFIRYRVDNSRCTGCGACQKNCKMNIKVWKNPNSLDCIRCGECREVCPEQAIKLASLRQKD